MQVRGLLTEAEGRGVTPVYVAEYDSGIPAASISKLIDDMVAAVIGRVQLHF